MPKAKFVCLHCYRHPQAPDDYLCVSCRILNCGYLRVFV